MKAGQRLSVVVQIKDLEPGTYPIVVRLEGCQEKKKVEVPLTLVIKPEDFDSGDWTSFGRNPDGNRVALDGNGPKTAWPGKLWEKSMSYMQTYSFSSPVTYENMGLFLNSDALLCIDLSTGNEKWAYKTGGYGTPAIWDNKIYFNAHKSLTCVDIDTGLRLWGCKASDYNHSSPIIYQGMIFDSLDSKTLNCLDALTGKVIWQVDTDSSISTSLAAFDNKLYYCTKTKLSCLDIKTSKSVWAIDLKGDCNNYIAISNGNVYLCQDLGIIKCFDAQNGAEKWSKALPNSTRCSPVVWDEKIYIGDSQGFMHCLQEKDGKEHWNFKTGDAIYSTSTISDGKLYVGSFDNNLYCLNAKSGAYLWAFKINNRVWNEVAVSKGKILISSVTNNIYCLGDIENLPDRKTPVKLVVYSPSDAVDPCSTIQLHADIINKYNDVLPGYEFEWSVDSFSGTISKEGLFIPENEGTASLTCKSAGFEIERWIGIFSQLVAENEYIEFKDVESCTPLYETLTFSQQEDCKMKVKLASTSDLVTLSTTEFQLEPYQEVDVEIKCEITRQPNIPQTKFYINIEYTTDKTNKKCYKKIEGLIKFKQP
jgi:outer membrane protein assembly factor BamB